MNEPVRKVVPRTLLAPQVYPHAVRDVRLVETHISWVLLTGDYAYKIKKPVNFGFVDFSTLARRRQACIDELRLNRRYAPQLYLDLVPITGSEDRPRVGGDGEPFEYAVRMRQFPQSQQLDCLLAAGRLGTADMDALGEAVAAMHATAPVGGPESPHGRPAQVLRDADDNLDALMAGTEGPTRKRVSGLAAWTLREHRRLLTNLVARHAEGHVREVHGDLHLANLVRIDGSIVPFDCIEFSESLRWNDTISDLAFLTMDLQARDRADLAHRALSRYLEIGGDYAGLPLLRYYEVYRALVRAKVALIRRNGASGSERDPHAHEFDRYLALAETIARKDRRAIVLMHGLSGSGKTWLSTQLVGALPAIRVRSDLERKRLHGVPALGDSGSAIGGGIYGEHASHRTYDRLAALARHVTDAGETAILDAAFLRREDRARFHQLARDLAVPFAIVSCEAPEDELFRRVEARRQRGTDASEAGREVLERQLQVLERLEAEEQPATLHVPVGDCVDPPGIAARLGRHLFTTSD
jgi:aminoglycoside phosphotransferase family enzyme/predicted kinase